MDGVLVDSNATVESHWSQWAARRGLPVAEVMRGAHGTPTRDNVARFVAADEVVAETAWIESLPVDGDDDVALPGAAAALSQRVMPVAVVTSAPNQVARWRLERAGLPVPAVVVGADDVARGKPDAAPYLRAAALLGVDPSRCVGVEDSPVGLAALRAAGAAPLAVLTTFDAGELDALAHLPDLAALVIEPGQVSWTPVST
ncbi:MAG: mannitol-/sugar-/sorbitol-6-phosphatase [Pseudonocardiales bacterium]|nr:mannitol-/sugar-/sorbitol-6-phosphatase [Pseudonocardiales bacterium]